MRYVGQRILFSILSLCVLLFITFLLSHVVSGDPAIVAAGPNAGADKIAAVRQEMGLDRPLLVQFWIYCSNILHGDLGTSWFTRQPIASDIIRELPPSLELVFVAMVINLAVSLPLGLLTARYAGTTFDDVVRLVVMAGAGLPIFWLAIILQQVVAGQWRLLPTAGRLGFENRDFTGATGFTLLDSLMQGRFDVFADALAHLVLPAFALTLLFTAVGVRITRTAMMGEFRKDYVVLARAKGASEGRIMVRHVFANGATPALTVFGMQFGWMLGATVLVEEIFGRPGIGRYAVKAVTQSDIHAVVAVVFVVGLVFLISNLVVDIALFLLTPRKHAGA
ncbi:peptide/nickel transport system permease protein [Kaistia soli DSM 19436]|uniref:Peptide/nickel transport system permease protein n=1 Tax=Kaistia soli DSM 19436 TaxID=1122133 RepID=A0A1M5E799_9HYPH|nr:ABC transporter permease [Kaistia soli]SHF75129.1 peptide/nickel transport system permease protein [Kaistia soli DSM 19436]